MTQISIKPHGSGDWKPVGETTELPVFGEIRWGTFQCSGFLADMDNFTGQLIPIKRTIRKPKYRRFGGRAQCWSAQ